MRSDIIMKKLIPAKARLRYQLVKRYLREHILKPQKFAQHNANPLKLNHKLSHYQEIKMSHSFGNKVHNIDLCLEHINHVVIEPSQVFSFWQLVPQPVLKNGFKTGRNLVNGQIREDVGGGICQVSGILYINALKAGLKIIERHSHSIDIYQEHERFTPLGSDATVVYGYKDLQFQNTYRFPIQIIMQRLEQQLICNFYSPEDLPDFDLNFQVDMTQQLKCVTTYVNEVKVTTNQYKIL